MGTRGNSSTPDAENLQIHQSWAPVTPGKPIPTKPRSICMDRPGNQLCQVTWCEAQRSPPGFSQETREYGVNACSASNSYIDIHQGFNNWEAALTGNIRGSEGFDICSEYSLDSVMLNRVPFGNLLALADAVASTLDSSNLKDGIYFGSSSLQANGNGAPDKLHYGESSLPSEAAFDLNLASGRLDASSSENFSSHLAPITPDQPKKAGNKQVPDMQNLNIDQRIQEARRDQRHEDTTLSIEIDKLHQYKEQQQQPDDLLCSAISTQSLENHNPDKGENLSIDLNKTPQQKPRRKKHRPKVVTEGKPKRTPKPVTPKPAGPKRKYVRKKGINQTTPTVLAEGTTGSADPKTATSIAKSCRRKLDFETETQEKGESSSCRTESSLNAESQAQNFCTRVESTLTVLLDEGAEITVEKTNVGIAYNLARSMNKVLEEYISMPEKRDPNATASGITDPQGEALDHVVQNEHARGKCRILFSDKTHDKQGNSIEIMATNAQSAPRSPNGSHCSSNEHLTNEHLTRNEQGRGLKRGHSCTLDVAKTNGTNMTGVHYNSLHGYLAMFPVYSYAGQNPGIYFPPIHKKKRTEKGHHSTMSSTSSSIGSVEKGEIHAMPFCPGDAYAGSYAQKTNLDGSAPQFTSGSPSDQNQFINAQGKQQPPVWELPFNHLRRMTKKRSKGPTKVRDLASLIGIAESKQLPPFPVGGAPTIEYMQGYKSSHHIHTCMEALSADTRAPKTTKKRTRRHLFANIMANGLSQHPAQKGKLTVDVVAEMLNSLDINRESIQIRNPENGALVPYRLKYEEQKALVLYQRDGTIMPYGGLFEPIRKRHPRPKVDLDEETTRVWKLLLENINSEGIDGTDEEKVKWWEEERQVFQGRADSFIARMHLVQGDRRFSPWKGSVVDSVIGVFLTQNVSDHLSSSAFMSLAAQFPLKPKTYPRPLSEETTPLVKEPETCVPDREEAIKWHEQKSNPPACIEDSLKAHSIGQIVNRNDSLESDTSGAKSMDNLNCNDPYFLGHCEEIYNTPTARRMLTQMRGTIETCTGDKRGQDNELSPQSSVVCSHNSIGSISHPAERIGSCSQGNLAANQTIMSNPNSVSSSASFVELLQRAGTALHGVYSHGTPSSYNRNKHNHPEETAFDMRKQNMDGSDSPNSSIGPVIPSRNRCLYMTSNFGALEHECFERMDKESLLYNVSKKSEENCRSEQSGVTAESVPLSLVQKIIPQTLVEAFKSCNDDDQTCGIHQGELYKICHHQYRPVWDINSMDKSEAEKHNSNGIPQALDVQSLSKETLLVSESASAINDSENSGQKAVDSSLKDHGLIPGKAGDENNLSTFKARRGRIGKEKQNAVDWDILRKEARSKSKGRERSTNTMDSLDWEAVRCADVKEIAYTIKERGMNNMLAERIKDFLNRIVKEHGSIDLEWLRDVPPDKAKEFLLSVRGLGLKSVECVRLLTLHHLAFPVDTNVGRIAVRLGWVPLQPLPESLQLHLLELYPVLESIQRYLWPRLCKLDQRTLYELHYQMITFGKVFCTKSKPNCNACPMRGECRHFASAFASARLALPAPEEKSLVSTTESKAPDHYPVEAIRQMQLPPPEVNQCLQAQSRNNICEPIVEVPRTPEPIIEVPATPEPELQKTEIDIEDSFYEDPEEIPTIRLNIEEFTQNLQNYMQQNMELQDGDMSKALVALTPEAASIPIPKLKNMSRLRTEHQVYELPDSHPLLEGLDKREPDDPCSYLLAIWTPGETPNSIQPPEIRCSSQEFGNLCNDMTCFSCNSIREANSQTVRGTLLIPCRTAMRGSFPLNGTYFQVNEVFADHDSSLNPIDVPRAWIWNLPRRTVYFGTSIPTIFKGLSTESIQYCFWRGFVCVRGFDQKTRAPRPLIARLHFPASKLSRTKGKTDDKQE